MNQTFNDRPTDQPEESKTEPMPTPTDSPTPAPTPSPEELLKAFRDDLIHDAISEGHMTVEGVQRTFSELAEILSDFGNSQEPMSARDVQSLRDGLEVAVASGNVRRMGTLDRQQSAAFKMATALALSITTRGMTAGLTELAKLIDDA